MIHLRSHHKALFENKEPFEIIVIFIIFFSVIQYEFTRKLNQKIYIINNAYDNRFLDLFYAYLGVRLEEDFSLQIMNIF